MTLQEILDLLNQQSGSGGAAPSGAASISSNNITNSFNPLNGPADQFGGLLSTLGGGNPASGSAQEGGAIGNLLLGPFGGFLGDFIGSLVGGGIPRSAKTEALGGALESSGNSLEDIIGQFINKGAGAGRVLSESGNSTFGQSTYDLASFLTALTGQQLPNVTASGFQHNPTFTAPGLGNAGTNFKLPPGYNFMDPSKAQDAASIIERIVGLQQPAGQAKPAEADWQKVISQLISRGDLTKYNGPMGAVGASPTSPGAIPNVSLPHPLAQNQPQLTPPPYPVTAGA